MAVFPDDITALKDPTQDSDGSHTDVITIPASAPYTHVLGQGAPLNYPSGWQVIPPSGVAGIVTVSGGTHISWTEVALGASLTAGQFSVDDSTAPTGGTIYFAAADAGMTGVSITYTGALEWNKAVVLALMNGIRAARDGRGAASGLAGLDAKGLFQGSSAAGTPTISNVPAGSTVTLVAGSTNARGTIKVVIAAGGPALGINTRVCTVSFGGGLAASPTLKLSAGADVAQSPLWYYQNKSASGFDLMYGGPTATNVNAYYCDYVAIA